MPTPNPVSALTRRRFDRRRFMVGAGRALAAAAAGESLFPGARRRAKSAPATDNVVRVLGVSNGAPRDWTEFEKDTGLKVEWTPIGDDVGIFLHEMLANDAGEHFDLVTCLSGAYQPLIDQDLLAPIDTARLPRWAGVAPVIRQAAPMDGAGPRVWSVPFQLNADGFAYRWKTLGEPDAPAEVSWKLVFDDPRTAGKVALDAGIFTLANCAIYVKYHKLAEIGDIGDMTPSECDSVADYLIERKKAGQFRTLYKSYDEQVQLLVSGEVLAETCWEPAAIEAKAKGLDVANAYTVEGYDKWSQNFMIPVQAKDRGAEEKALKTIDWFMGGAYAAEKSALEGYVTPRPDLGMEYARDRGWDSGRLAAIALAIDKLDKKFAKPLYQDPGYFKNMEYYERAVARFKNA
jgi:spermidine/putrescine-binding protein